MRACARAGLCMLPGRAPGTPCVRTCARLSSRPLSKRLPKLLPPACVARQPHSSHARQTAVIRIALATTGRLVWHCGEHTAKPQSAPGGRFLIATICCFLWHLVPPPTLPRHSWHLLEPSRLFRALKHHGVFTSLCVHMQSVCAGRCALQTPKKRRAKPHGGEHTVPYSLSGLYTVSWGKTCCRPASTPCCGRGACT